MASDTTTVSAASAQPHATPAPSSSSTRPDPGRSTGGHWVSPRKFRGLSLEELRRRLEEAENFEDSPENDAEIAALRSAIEAQEIDLDRGRQRKRSVRATNTVTQTVTAQHTADGTVRTTSTQKVAVN